MTLGEQLDAASGDLTEEEASVARTYVERLQKAGITSVPQLVQTVSDVQTNPAVRDMAYSLLAWLRVRSASTVLTRAFEQTQDDTFVWAAANALVRVRAEDAIPTLLGVLERSSPTKQAAAAWTLGWLGGSHAVPVLRSVAMDPHRAVDVRAHATEALGVLHAQEAVDDLIALLSVQSPEIRYWAAYSLGQIADPVSVPELERVAASDSAVLSNDRSVRQEAIDALAAIHAKERDNS
jgi:HEAT repeat protein